MAEPNFVELASFVTPPPANGIPRGHVIKNPHVAPPSDRSVQVCAEGDDRPTLILRKKGEVVVGFDLVCPCGRTSTVNLEFREE